MIWNKHAPIMAWVHERRCINDQTGRYLAIDVAKRVRDGHALVEDEQTLMEGRKIVTVVRDELVEVLEPHVHELLLLLLPLAIECGHVELVVDIVLRVVEEHLPREHGRCLGEVVPQLLLDLCHRDLALLHQVLRSAPPTASGKQVE